MNSFTRIATFGIAAEEDAPYVDKLELTFSKGVVVRQAYSENVLNISLPGFGSSKPDR